MDSQSDRDVAEFLGSDAAIGGPFAVLGLKYAPIDQAMILRACQLRLGRISEHRRSQTPAADEVRLAVHAAASQLLDPELREELAKHWPEGSGEISLVGESPKAWRVEPTSRLDERLKQQALTLLGACGGWNTRSRKRLGQFARMNQISAAQLVAGIIGEQSDDGKQGETRDGGGNQVVRGPSLIDPAAGSLPWAMIPVVYVMMGLLLISVGYMKSSEVDGRADGGVAAIKDLDGGSEIGSRFPSSETRGGEKLVVSERRHYSAILFELEKANSVGVSEIEAGRAFSEIGERLGEQWTEFTVEELDRAVVAVDGVLGGILNPEVFDAAGSFLSLDDPDRPGSVFRLAVRSLLFGTRIDGGGVVEYSVMSRRAGVRSGEGAFDQYLLTEFVRLAKLSSDDPAWWAWWIGQLRPMADRVEGFDESRIFEAAYWRLTNGRIGDGWTECTKQIVQELEWREGSAARSWMMGLVVDPKVRSDRLAILTQAMVVHSSAKGLEVGMVVGKDDSMAEREAYLGKLRQRWATDRGASDGVRGQLVERIELLMRMTQSPTRPSQALSRGVELARVNSACLAYQRNDEASVIGMIQLFDTPMNSGQVSGKALDLSSSAGDELWATKARNLDDADELFAHLRAMDQFDVVGPKSAHALVYLAMQAPNLQVRAGAERAMMVRRDEVAILIALDRIAGAKRTTRRMAELIHGYIEFDGDLGDAAASRRALLERLVLAGMLDGGSSTGIVDGYWRSMEESYRLRTRSGGDEGAKGYFNEQVLGLMTDGGEVPGQTRAGLLIRLRQARGPIQEFVAYQAAALELLATDVASRHPGLGARVDRVMNENSDKMKQTVDAVVQIMLNERAMAELWMLVLESEGVS